MFGGTTGFFETNARRASFGLSPYAAVVSLAYLLWGLFFSAGAAGAYADFEHGFSLLAAFGAVGCLGHLAVYAYRSSEYLSSLCSVLGDAGVFEDRQPGDILVDSVDWPLLVALLFGPFSMLLAGLGGWV